MKLNPSFLNKRFRTGHLFLLKEWNDLDPAEQKTLAALYDGSDVYGMFIPQDPALHRTPKIAFRDTALLYLHLAIQNRLPNCIAASWSAAVQTTLVQLVLDEILEVEWQGSYVSGSRAAAALYGHEINEGVVPMDHLSRLSMQAIIAVFSLRGLPANYISAKLYSFHTTPWDAADKTAFHATQTVQEFLFSETGEETARLLLQHWTFAPASEEIDWFSWSKRHVPETVYLPDFSTYKLYISPAVQHLPAVLQKTIPVLTASESFQFKIGASVHGLLRPDKMVAYFCTKEALLKTAAALEKSLLGIEVQGVPFTTQVSGNGLLSWGVDPPQAEAFAGAESGSWRTSVTMQLAAAISQAQSDKLSFEEAVPFIRAKLYSNGVDMKDWSSIEELLH